MGDVLVRAGPEAAYGSYAGERVGGLRGQRAEYFFAELGSAAGGDSETGCECTDLWRRW